MCEWKWIKHYTPLECYIHCWGSASRPSILRLSHWSCGPDHLQIASADELVVSFPRESALTHMLWFHPILTIAVYSVLKSDQKLCGYKMKPDSDWDPVQDPSSIHWLLVCVWVRWKNEKSSGDRSQGLYCACMHNTIAELEQSAFSWPLGIWWSHLYNVLIAPAIYYSDTNVKSNISYNHRWLDWNLYYQCVQVVIDFNFVFLSNQVHNEHKYANPSKTDLSFNENIRH